MFLLPYFPLRVRTIGTRATRRRHAAFVMKVIISNDVVFREGFQVMMPAAIERVVFKCVVITLFVISRNTKLHPADIVTLSIYIPCICNPGMMYPVVDTWGPPIGGTLTIPYLNCRASCTVDDAVCYFVIRCPMRNHQHPVHRRMRADGNAIYLYVGMSSQKNPVIIGRILRCSVFNDRCFSRILRCR